MAETEQLHPQIQTILEQMQAAPRPESIEDARAGYDRTSLIWVGEAEDVEDVSEEHLNEICIFINDDYDVTQLFRNDDVVVTRNNNLLIHLHGEAISIYNIGLTLWSLGNADEAVEQAIEVDLGLGTALGGKTRRLVDDEPRAEAAVRRRRGADALARVRAV